MGSKVVAFLKTNAGHLIGVALLIVALGGMFHIWLANHDAAVLRVSTVKTAEGQVATLKAQQVTVAAAAKGEVVQLQKAAVAVKTTPQVLAALPSVTPTAAATNPAPDLAAAVLPDAPDRVSVLAVPLYQDLNEAKQNAVDLAACADTLDLQKQIDTQKDVEIVALKKKQRFWARVKSTAITLGVGAAAGAVGYAVATR